MRPAAQPPGDAGRTVLLTSVERALVDYRPSTTEESAAVGALHRLMASSAPFARDRPVHVTGSALVVHPESRRILLRWHPRLERWMQVGGHGDKGEGDPFAVAIREAAEETGLHDLCPFPRLPPTVIQVAIVAVPATTAEAAHRHVDVRYLLATKVPDRIRPETPDAPLVWSAREGIDRLAPEVGMETLFSRAWRAMEDGELPEEP